MSLGNLEKVLVGRIAESSRSLQANLADKMETKKALKLLEKQLKNLYDLTVQGGGMFYDSDAMLTRKQMGGLMTCASCEKDVVNI